MCGHYQMCNLGNGAGMLGYGVALGAHGAGMLMGWRGLEKGGEGGGRYIYVFPPVDIYTYIWAELPGAQVAPRNGGSSRIATKKGLALIYAKNGRARGSGRSLPRRRRLGVI